MKNQGGAQPGRAVEVAVGLTMGGDLHPSSNQRYLEFQKKNGAGERIRTVDPNLGKVMLYP